MATIEGGYKSGPLVFVEATTPAPPPRYDWPDKRYELDREVEWEKREEELERKEGHASR